MRILTVVQKLPKPDRSGGGLRLFGLLELLARRHEVAIYPLAEGDDPDSARYAAMHRAIGVEPLASAWTPGLERALGARAYDAVLLEFWYWAHLGLPIVRRLQPWARTIVEIGDIHFRREEAGLAVGVGDAAVVAGRKRDELDTYARADALICISGEDDRSLDGHGPTGRRFVVPHLAATRDRAPGARGPEALFLGGFDHKPNPDGLLWFAREVWPAVRAEVPAARLTVVGSRPTAEVLALSGEGGIEVVGWAPEVDPYFDRAAMLVAPLRFGGGVKIKVVEAMARGVPVATTPVGAQGLDVRDGEHLEIAGGAEELARRVVGLIRDPGRAETIGRAGQEYVAANFAPGAIGETLEAILSAVVGRGRPRLPPPGWVARSAAIRGRRLLLGRWKGRARRRPDVGPGGSTGP